MSESIEQIEDELILVALKFGVSGSVAADLSRAILVKIKSSFAGDRLYINKDSKQSRNEEIKGLFNGVNQAEICDAFGISKSTFYRVIRDEG